MNLRRLIKNHKRLDDTKKSSEENKIDFCLPNALLEIVIDYLTNGEDNIMKVKHPISSLQEALANKEYKKAKDDHLFNIQPLEKAIKLIKQFKRAVDNNPYIPRPPYGFDEVCNNTSSITFLIVFVCGTLLLIKGAVEMSNNTRLLEERQYTDGRICFDAYSPKLFGGCHPWGNTTACTDPCDQYNIARYFTIFSILSLILLVPAYTSILNHKRKLFRLEKPISQLGDEIQTSATAMLEFFEEWTNNPYRNIDTNSILKDVKGITDNQLVTLTHRLEFIKNSGDPQEAKETTIPVTTSCDSTTPLLVA